MLEVSRSPGQVAAEHYVNRLGGQVGAPVQRLDRGIVPSGNRAVENLGRRRGVQNQRSQALDVVSDRDRAEDHRQVPRSRAAALLGRVVLVEGQWHIRPAEIGLVAGEFADPGARTIGRVVQRLTGAGLFECLDKAGHRVGLRCRPAGLQRLRPTAVHLHRQRGRRRSSPSLLAWVSLPHPDKINAPAVRTLSAAPNRLSFIPVPKYWEYREYRDERPPPRHPYRAKRPSVAVTKLTAAR